MEFLSVKLTIIIRMHIGRMALSLPPLSIFAYFLFVNAKTLKPKCNLKHLHGHVRVFEAFQKENNS